MEYRKPTISVLAKAISAIQGNETATKASPFADGSQNPHGAGENAVSAAYEADE